MLVPGPPVNGIERPLVQGDEEHAVIVPEDRLRAVAVVDVPIDDRDPLDPQRVLGVTRCDRDVAEQAEPHRAVSEGVVPGWTGEREATRLHGLDRAARGEQRRLERGGIGDRVAVEPHRLLECGDALDVGGVVHTLDLVARGGSRFARVTERLEKDVDPLLALRVAEAARRRGAVPARGARSARCRLLEAARQPAEPQRLGRSRAGPPVRLTVGEGWNGRGRIQCRDVAVEPQRVGLGRKSPGLEERLE